MNYFLGIDVSTTASKAVLIDQTGAVIAIHANSHAPFSVPSQPLWSEQNPNDWTSAAIDAIKNVVQKVDAKKILCIGLTGQMHGLVILDRYKKPIRAAILWNDQRSSAECLEIENELGHDFLCQHIGSKILPCHLLSKLRWLKKQEPHHYQKISHIITPKDYVRFCLSGVLAVDKSDGSGFGLMDIAKRDWSDVMLESQHIPKSWLPDLFESIDICSVINEAGANATGLKIGTPIIAGAGDQPAQSVGCHLIDSRTMSLQVGTSGVVTKIDDYVPAKQGEYLNYCHTQSSQWIAMGLTASAAGSLRWFRDHIAMRYSFKEIDEMAASVSPGSDGLLFTPDIGGNIHPHANANARGHFVGFTERHTLAHMARAVLEGVAFSLREMAEVMNRQSNAQPNHFMISGGAANSLLWKTIFADIFQKPLNTVNNVEGAAFGVAIMAGVAVQQWPSVEVACERLVKPGELIEPSNKDQYEQSYFQWKLVYPSVKNIWHCG
ncbi:MAG: xylulokinase [Gammaproteobacteria bacterium CG_4_10_14_0_8_um_filter_38_16]|nr:MAG: xylulokinase [Gammaproteobacteria bacterium CG_4_10_14_0_8_um_filter_38_16]PJA03214.1 MAG: xylulokinase [Gammaproteobacteria bacterium CG_4_10_14_0_2_um_filter_38_22]